MAAPTPRRKATKHRLVEAAITEFAERGFDATSVEQLCDSAGFTRGAFYSNFSNKDELGVAVLEYHRDLALDGLDQVFTTPPADADLAWLTETALPRFFTILSPSPEFRITLMELRMRSYRSPALAAEALRIQAELRPGLISLVDQVAAQTGLSFELPTSTMIDVFEALYFYALVAEPESANRELLGTIVSALARRSTT